MVESDAEGSSFFDFFNVAACDGVEFLEECCSDEYDDAGLVSVFVAPESFKAFDGCPSGLVPFGGVSFLNADDVGLSCESE